MKRIALAIASVALVFIPTHADAAPKHDHKPVVVQRVIDWD